MIHRDKLIAALLCCTSTIAHAQTDEATMTGETVENSEIPQTESAGIQDIIVTATRRQESLQEIPVAVTAVTSDQLAATGVIDVRSLTIVAPGYNGGRASMVMQPTMRGVGSNGVGVGDEGNVAIYVDGIYQGDPYSTQLEFVEVERVEVLRGPQGTVFGRNATGGLINVITPDPEFYTSGRASVRYGQLNGGGDTIVAKGYLTTGVTENLAIDFAGLYRQNDGYVDDLLNGGQFGRGESINLRSKLLFEPSENVQLVLTGSYIDTKAELNVNQPVDGNSLGASYGGIVPEEPWQAVSNLEPIGDFERFDLSLRGSIDLGGVTLESTTAYTRTDVHQITDTDVSSIELGFTDMRVTPRHFTQEVRLLSNGNDRLDWTSGLYYFELEGGQPISIGVGTNPGYDQIIFLDPVVSTKSYAAYAEGTYELTENLFLTLGGRFTHEERSFSQSVNGNDLFGTVKSSFDKFTYRGALRYEFTPDASAYVSYGTGFKSGVYNGIGTSPNATDPETISALEAGLKADPASWLRANIAVFYYDYADLQASSRDVNSAFVLQNAAEAEIYGGELEVTLAPTSNFNIRGALAYSHARYKEFPAAQDYVPLPGGGNLVTSIDAAGNQVLRAPDVTFVLAADYTVDLGAGEIRFSGNYFYSGRVYYNPSNTVSQDPYSLVSGEIRWSNETNVFDLFLFGKNLTNEPVYQFALPGTLSTYASYEKPREIGVGVALRF